MAVELVIPEVGESITEAVIGRWLKNEGDAVQKDEPIVEIETDKITVELPAPASGTFSRRVLEEGAQAKVGDVVGYLEEGAAAGGTDKSAAPRGAPQPEPSPEPETEQPKQQATPPETAQRKPGSAAGNGQEQRVMPAAKRLLEEHGLAAEEVQATGPGGRLLKEDVQRHVEQGKAPRQQAQPEPAAPPQQPTAPRQSSVEEQVLPDLSTEPGREEELVPMTPLRRRIAERLVQAQQTGALLTTFNECDMSAVMDLRAKYKDTFEKKYDIKLGFMSFFVRAAVDALRAFPAVNAEVRGTNIIYKNYCDIGIAIGGGKGLVVPVLRNAEQLGFAEIEQQIAEYAKAAKDNKLKLEDLQGGTFTITNGGIYGSMLSTPIINPPQSGVLGMHNIQKRPMVQTVGGKDELVIRPMMYLALTYDHRLVDGREAVSFLVRVKQGIEDPSRLLMEV
jgi:2-oxoglutarate dehydrogenase E2 component (dihydrolipoamide succinyltransferase)